MRKLLISFLLTLCLAATMPVTAKSTHPLQDIRDTATNYVQANIASGNNDVHISATALDPRLKLPLCTQKLQAHMPWSNFNSGNTTVGVRCEGDQPWSLYVPVTVTIYREVLVATRPLAQGQTLAKDDVEIQRRDINRLAGGYLSQAKLAIGQILTRPIQPGRPLLSNFLKAPTKIRRGQIITMLARQSSFEVRSLGESLMDGAVGERIKVRNRRSKRIVEGVIAENGMVFVN